jgi:predicted ATPase
VPSNLPAELSTFVGRADDLERGVRLLGESRLATFTGAGGCGKTRLARQVAMRVAERFPGGVWWVELASLADGGLVTDRVARTLGLQTGEADAVADYFADGAALLLLDNCEHIVDGVAEFVTAVLRGTELLCVLTTSRHPLGVEGETTWRVPSLALPPQAAGNVAELRATADGMDRPGRPLGEAGARVLDALRLIAADTHGA